MRVFTIKSSDVGRCPKHSLSVAHYRDDGTCRCGEREAAQQAVEAATLVLAEAREALRKARKWLEST